MVVAATLSLSAAQEPTSFTIREAEASWISRDASKPGDVVLDTIFRLGRETTESGDLVDHVQYSDLTYVAVGDGTGRLDLVITESVVVDQTSPVGTFTIDPELRRFALDQTFPAEHCVATPPNYSTGICSPVEGVHILAEFIRLDHWYKTFAGRGPAQPGEFVTDLELASNGTADLSVDGVPVSGSCGDSPEVCGAFRWIRFRIH